MELLIGFFGLGLLGLWLLVICLHLLSKLALAPLDFLSALGRRSDSPPPEPTIFDARTLYASLRDGMTLDKANDVASVPGRIFAQTRLGRHEFVMAEWRDESGRVLQATFRDEGLAGFRIIE